MGKLIWDGIREADGLIRVEGFGTVFHVRIQADKGSTISDDKKPKRK